MLARQGLHEFEVSSLANLGPSNAEEAKALVPSLDPAKNPEVRDVACTALHAGSEALWQRKVQLSDEEIDAMLNELAPYRGG